MEAKLSLAEAVSRVILMKRKKILIFVDLDMLVRHFIKSGVLNDLEEDFDVKYVFHRDSSSEKKSVYTDPSVLGLKDWCWFDLPRTRGGSWDHLYTPGTLWNLRKSDYFKDRLELAYLTRQPKWVDRYNFLVKSKLYPLYSLVFKACMGVYKPMIDFLDEEKPDLIIHPTILQGMFINDLLLAARQKAIPSLLLMNSWDNPSQKAAVTGFPDKLAVWGRQTYNHARDYMGIPEDRLEILGAAQFDVYRDPVQEDDDLLREMFGVPKGVPIVLYGGTSKSVIESMHLETLDKAIASGILPECHILYRPHPRRGPLLPGEKSFYDLGLSHVSLDPFMKDYYDSQVLNQTKYSAFDLADYKVTARLMKLIDAVVSPLSTILLEAVMHEKPVQILHPKEVAGDMAKLVSELGPRLVHFVDLKGDGILVSDTTDQMVAGVAKLLSIKDRQDIKQSLRETAAFFVDMSGPRYGQALRRLAASMTSEKNKKN